MDELEPEVASRLISGLDDQIMSKIAAGLFYQNVLKERTLAKAQAIVRGTAGNAFIEARRKLRNNGQEGKEMTAMEPTHKAFAEFMLNRDKTAEEREKTYLDALSKMMNQMSSMTITNNNTLRRQTQPGRYQPQYDTNHSQPHPVWQGGQQYQPQQSQ
ncbi:MAG: hypothetical protein Q9182_007607 [Xanthomendoza sp. 2 TL-2023]